MAGVPGRGGPPPKRSDQRRRVNAPDAEVTKAAGAPVVPVPPPDPEWHPVAARWFESLAESGQAVFYEPSDWGTAYVIAESISREMKPQVVGTTEDGEPVWASKPPTGAAISAWLQGMTALMVTEGDRRRARLELHRPQPSGEEVDADVSDLDRYRSRIPTG